MYFPPAAPHEKREPEGLRLPCARCGRVRLLLASLPAFLPKDEPEGQRYHENQDFCHRLRPLLFGLGLFYQEKLTRERGCVLRFSYGSIRRDCVWAAPSIFVRCAQELGKRAWLRPVSLGSGGQVLRKGQGLVWGRRCRKQSGGDGAAFLLWGGLL